MSDLSVGALLSKRFKRLKLAGIAVRHKLDALFEVNALK